MVQREEYMKRIRPFIGNELVKVLTGLRRSGKSVMLELIKKELLSQGIPDSRFVSFTFENMSNAYLCTAKALHEKVKAMIGQSSGKFYLFFDEIQEVKEWEKAINSFRVEFDCDIYITGSNAMLLSGELATYLAGRYVEFVIYPFSYREFIELYHTIYPEENEQKTFNRYLTTGGMPYLSNLRFEQQPCQLYLQDLYNSVSLKDVVKRNNIRDVDLLERIIAYITANIGTTFSATSISKYLKNEGRTVAPETILNYIKACADAFLFYPVKRQDLKGKKILNVSEKYYIADHGIREAVFGGNLKDINLILENIVFMELLRHGYHVTVGKIGNKEIDFIGERQKEKIYIQVSYLLASEETIKREFDVYSEVKDNYPKFVVSMDEIDLSRNGIRHMNIRDFLSMEEWTSI